MKKPTSFIPLFLFSVLISMAFTKQSWAENQNTDQSNQPTQSNIKATVKEAKPGKTFQALLTDMGFARGEAAQLLSRRIIPPKMHLVPGEKYLVIEDPKSGRTEGRFYMDYSNEAFVFWKQKESVGVEKKPIDFTIIKKTVAGLVKGSIIESIKKLIPDEWPAFRFMDAFSWDLNLAKALKKNDSYKFTVEEKYDMGHFVKYGEILEAQLTTQGNTLKRILWANDTAKVFVDPSTRFEDRPFYAPIDYLHISSPFTKRRFHPVRHNYQPHLGVDFALDQGSPIYAPRDGVVYEIDHHRANGNYLMLKHDSGFITTYNHLDRWASGLKVGDTVKAGQVIGYVGCTGYCTSSHLDFRIRRGDYLYDPVALTKPYPFKERNYWESTKFKKLLNTLFSANSGSRSTASMN